MAAPPPTATVAVTQVHQPQAQAPYHPPHIPPDPSGLGSSEGPTTPRFGARPVLRLVVAAVLVAAAVIAFWLAANEGGGF